MTHNEFDKPNFDKNYWRHYGYSHDPFSTNAQDALYVSSVWEEYLDVLPQFSRFCNSLLLITGNHGVGKSSLVKIFIDEQLTNHEIIFLHAAECPGTEYLLQLLHTRFDAPYDENSTLPISEQLTEQLDFLKQNKIPRLLVIDDAEQLPLDMRQACLQIVQQQTALETCLPVILIGDQQLPEQFNALLTPTTARECLHIIEVVPLTLEQTEDYLIWACEQADGEADTSPFTSEDIDTIFQASHGVLSQINENARHLLAIKHKPHSNWKHLLRGKLLWWGATLIIIVILLYVYKFISRPPTLEKTFTTPIALRKHEPVAHKPETKQQKIGNMLVKTKTKVQAQKNATSTKQPTATKITSIKKIKPQAKPYIIKPSTKPKKTKKRIVTKPANDLFNRVMHTKLALQKKRILAIKDNNYTLQLLATPDLHTAQKFIIQHGLQATGMLVQTTQKGKQWYVVIYGIFPTKKQAQLAVKNLPFTLKPSQFWIRSYKSLHTTMH